MGGSRIKGPILEAAIRLFGKFGFEGVTTRGIAQEAHCMEGGIYRLYGNKTRLYEEAIASVVQGTLGSLAAIALGLYTEKSTKMGQEEIIKAAVHGWYSSFSQDGAKLLQQVLLNDNEHKPGAHQPFANVLAILQRTLESESEKAGKRFDAKTRTEGLISALFQLKLTYEGPADKEHQEVDRHLQDWLVTLPREDQARYPFRSREVSNHPRSSQRS